MYINEIYVFYIYRPLKTNKTHFHEKKNILLKYI